MNMWNVMIVGCGLSGIIAARELADQGNKVLIFEKRRHIGGNIIRMLKLNGQQNIFYYFVQIEQNYLCQRQVRIDSNFFTDPFLNTFIRSIFF